MSYGYGGRRPPSMGIGQTPTPPVPGFTLGQPAPGARGVPKVQVTQILPTWEEATANQGDINKYGNIFRKIGDENLLNMMRQRLEEMYAIDPHDADPDTGQKTARHHVRDWLNNIQYEVREGMPFIQALKAWWVRQGRNTGWWAGDPASSPESVNFGPNTDSSQNLVISQTLYNAFRDPKRPLWTPSADNGYVHIKSYDYFWNTILRQALIDQGYLAPDAEVNALDDGPMVKALESFYREGVAQGPSSGINYGRWPSDTSLGPNTAVNYGTNTGAQHDDAAANAIASFDPVAAAIFQASSGAHDEVRVDPNLLTAVLNGWSAREAGRRAAAAGALRTATIRPPLIGLPSQGATRPLVTMISPAVLRSAASAIAPAIRLQLLTPTK